MDVLAPPNRPEPAKSAYSSRWRHTIRFLAAFYALALVMGLRNLYYGEPSLLDLLVPIAFMLALGWWAVVDARVRGHPIPLLARPWFFLFAWFLVPAYVVWSRGWRAVGWIVLNCIGWYAVATATWLALNIIMGDQLWQAARYR
jgi:hypothetical protein